MKQYELFKWTPIFVSFSVNKKIKGTFWDVLFITLLLEMFFISVNITSSSDTMEEKVQKCVSECDWRERGRVCKKRKMIVVCNGMR